MSKICVLTPTRNRPHLLEMSKVCLVNQTVPKENLTWIILDNSDEGNEGWTKATEIADVRVVYTRIPPGKPLGELRNICIETGLRECPDADFFAFWDDDDYYMPKRFENQIRAMGLNPQASLCICREMEVFLTRENILMKVGPYPEHQGTCASYFVRKDYIQKNRFDASATKGEETSFCRKWTAKTVSLSPKDVLLVIGHPKNTVDKSQVYTNQRQFMADVVNQDNGKNIIRYKWIQSQPVWDLFYKTFLAADEDL